MNNGEDVICKITKITDLHYVISDALKMESISKLIAGEVSWKPLHYLDGCNHLRKKLFTKYL